MLRRRDGSAYREQSASSFPVIRPRRIIRIVQERPGITLLVMSHNDDADSFKCCIKVLCLMRQTWGAALGAADLTRWAKACSS
jgi:hypothetical protein